ncbi:MAG TPA: beta-phosphoglucomutase family hydrolase [Actinomycetaceae bacterium]|nr:beta-phosphoglucomutase family hydrolase [Actinomycetaceae bacterium]
MRGVFVLRLPAGITACLFDLDGVLTQTAAIHATAWQETFDAYLSARAREGGGPFIPFDPVEDYARYVDGKPRLDGVRDFLASREIFLPEGDGSDGIAAGTITGIGNRKNDRVLELIRTRGVEVFPGSRRFLDAVIDAGLARAVVSSSANAALILDVTGVDADIEVLVDGTTARELGLPGKPAPDTFLEAARRLGVAPSEAAVIEDALSGVVAGRAGGFGHIIGVNRLDQAEELRAHGADVVVNDLEELL